MSRRPFSAPPAMPTARAPLRRAIWPDGGADRAGRGRHDEGLPGLRLADLQQPGVRREAGHAEHAEGRGDRRRLGVELAQLRAGHDRVGLPAGVGEHLVAGRDALRARLDDLAHRAADHDVADLDGRGVGLGVAHPPAHVGVQREVERAQQHLALAHLRQLDGPGLEVAVLGLAHRPLRQGDLRGLHRSSMAPQAPDAAAGRADEPRVTASMVTSGLIRTRPVALGCWP